MKNRIARTFLTALLAASVLGLVACGGGGGSGSLGGIGSLPSSQSSSTGTASTVTVGSINSTGAAPHHIGEDCMTCHTTWNLVQTHDSSSTGFNSDCISCHGNMTDEKSLSSAVPGIHPKMCPYVYQAAGQTTINNTVCRYCHASVDYKGDPTGDSAGNLRKQVDASICRGCHTLAGPGRVLYK